MFVYLIFILVVLCCPCFALVSRLTPWRGFICLGFRHRKKRYYVIHLSPTDRIGRLTRSRTRCFHAAFVRELEGALWRADRDILFRSHLMRPAQIQLACSVLARYPTWRYRMVNVVIPRWERTGITLQNLLYEWRYTPTAACGVMVVVKQEK